MKAVVLASGGIDSCVCLAIAIRHYEVALLHVNYGQRTEKKELECFEKLANYYGIKEKLIVNLPHLKEIGGSSLTDEKMEIEEGLSDDIPSTYVPFRNANILAVAVSWAEVIGAERIFIGAIEEDAPGYPDCRKKFYDAFQKVIETGTKKGNIKICTPLIKLKKSKVVEIGAKLGAPFHLTWSCYKNEEKACGKCDSCLRRLRAFKEAGIKDPIPYE